jgi:hypothetical protein
MEDAMSAMQSYNDSASSGDWSNFLENLPQTGLGTVDPVASSGMFGKVGDILSKVLAGGTLSAGEKRLAGLLGGAGGAALKGFFGSGKGDTVSTDIAAWMKPYAVAAASGASNLPAYTSFYDAISQPYTTDWTGLTAAQRTAQMNPYLQGVLDPALAELRKQNALETNKLNATSAVRGAFGGTRNLLEQNLLGQRLDKGIADTTAKGYFDAYNNAMGAYEANQKESMEDWTKTFSGAIAKQGAVADTLKAFIPGAVSRSTTDEQNTWDKIGTGLVAAGGAIAGA